MMIYKIFKYMNIYNNTQYFVCPLFAWITACICLGIDSTNFLKWFISILLQPFLIHSNNSFSFLQFLFCKSSSNLLCAFSIGLRSGDCDGKSNVFIFWFDKYFLHLFDVCFGSLSCWNIGSSDGTTAYNDYFIWYCNIYLYWSAFNLFFTR